MDIQPHDTFFKQIFSDPKRVKILLDIFAEDIAQDIHSITPVNTGVKIFMCLKLKHFIKF